MCGAMWWSSGAPFLFPLTCFNCATCTSCVLYTHTRRWFCCTSCSFLRRTIFLSFLPLSQAKHVCRTVFVEECCSDMRTCIVIYHPSARRSLFLQRQICPAIAICCEGRLHYVNATAPLCSALSFCTSILLIESVILLIMTSRWTGEHFCQRNYISQLASVDVTMFASC